MQAPTPGDLPEPDPITSSASALTLEEPHPPLLAALHNGFLHLTDDQFESVVADERGRRGRGSSQPTNQPQAENTIESMKQSVKLILDSTRQKTQAVKSRIQESLSMIEKNSKEKSTAGSNESASASSSENVRNGNPRKIPANGSKTQSRASRDRETNTNQNAAAAETVVASPIQAARAQNGGSTTSTSSLVTTTNTSLSGNKNRRPHHASDGDKNPGDNALKKKRRVKSSASSCSRRPYAIGTFVKKHFPGHGWFIGEIVSNHGFYDVVYEDGDDEGFSTADSEMDCIVEEARSMTADELLARSESNFSMPPRDLTQTTVSNRRLTATSAATNKVPPIAAPPPPAATSHTHESRRSHRQPKATLRGAEYIESLRLTQTTTSNTATTAAAITRPNKVSIAAPPPAAPATATHHGSRRSHRQPKATPRGEEYLQSVRKTKSSTKMSSSGIEGTN